MFIWETCSAIIKLKNDVELLYANSHSVFYRITFYHSSIWCVYAFQPAYKYFQVYLQTLIYCIILAWKEYTTRTSGPPSCMYCHYIRRTRAHSNCSGANALAFVQYSPLRGSSWKRIKNGLKLTAFVQYYIFCSQRLKTEIYIYGVYPPAEAYHTGFCCTVHLFIPGI